MNSASAGVLLGLLLGNKVPAKRLQYKNKIIAPTDWVNLVFSSKKGKQNNLDEGVLAQTHINFPSENAEQQWRTLLQNWEMAEEYTKTLAFADEAESNNKQEPVPEILEGKYLHLLDMSNQVSLKMDAMEEKLNDIELSTERAVKQENTQQLIKYGSNCVSLLKKFNNEAPCWPSELIEQVTGTLEIIKQLISQRLNDWILRQSCHNVLELEKFRQRTQYAITGLKALHFDAGATQLESQVQRSIIQIEVRQKFSMTLATCDDYPRQPIPSDTTPVHALRSEMATGDSLIESLQDAKKVLSTDEINAYVKSIHGRQDKLRVCIKNHTEAFSRLYNFQPQSIIEVKETLEQANRLVSVFEDTRDASELKDMAQQIGYILEDVRAWQLENVSVERLQDLLREIIKEQLSALEVYLEEHDTDEIWDMSAIYQSLFDEHVSSANRRSEDWVKQQIKLIGSIDKLDKKFCQLKIKELSDCPSYLSNNDTEKVDSICISLKARVNEIKESSRLEKVKKWKSPLMQLNNISTLEQTEIEYYLGIAQNPPAEILPYELIEVNPIKDTLVARLDELSMGDILGRIWALPVHKIKEVLNAIVSHLKARDG